MFSLRRLGCPYDKRGRGFPDSRFVSPTIDHESRERVGRIQRKISSLFDGEVDVRAARLQSVTKLVQALVESQNDKGVAVL
jgi:hypothetical protein